MCAFYKDVLGSPPARVCLRSSFPTMFKTGDVLVLCYRFVSFPMHEHLRGWMRGIKVCAGEP